MKDDKVTQGTHGNYYILDCLRGNSDRKCSYLASSNVLNG